MKLDLGIFSFLFLLVALVWVFYTGMRRKVPSFPITERAPFLKAKSFRIYIVKGGKLAFWVAVLFLLIALSHPRAVQTLSSEQDVLKTEVPRSGIAIYFLLDQSGSMSEKVKTITGEVSKIDLAKEAILAFVDGKNGLNLPGRQNDLTGLIAFARVPDVICPLTLNREELRFALKGIQPIQEDTRNGTAIGYAIFKAVNIIVATKHFANRQEEAHKSVYNIANQAIIIITDGLQSPHPEDKDNPFRFMPPDEAIDYAKDNGCRVFYIGIDPILSGKDYANDIQKLKSAMQGSGGELFLANSQNTVEDILSKIDSMEKSPLAPEVSRVKAPVHEVSLVGLFITLALLSLAAGVLVETSFARSST